MTTGSEQSRDRNSPKIGILVLTLLLPGLIQTRIWRKQFAAVSLGISVLAWVVGLLLVGVGLFSSMTLVGLLTSNTVLVMMMSLLVLLAINITVTATSTIRYIAKVKISSARRGWRLLLVSLITLLQLSALGWAFANINAQRMLMNTLFSDPAPSASHSESSSVEIPKASESIKLVDGRVNVLLLGGDAGAGRSGLRPDSISVVSVDAKTGESVIIGVPRNLEQAPFRAGSPLWGPFPNGYNCGSSCLISFLYTYGSGHPNLYSSDEYAGKDPGIEATRDAVEGVLNIEIPYVVLIDMSGFADLVNAVGGIEVCVPNDTLAQDRKTVFKAGCQHMTGDQALLYSRTRYDSNDYGRMAKQRLVQQALIQQVNPMKLITNFQSVAGTGSRYVSTNIPRDQLPAFLELALKAKGQPIEKLELVPPTVNVVNPDFSWIQSEVARLLQAQ